MSDARTRGDTRERIVTHTASLFRRQGFNATGLKEIVAGASAPFGSVYHFFPGGKEQLGAEVIRVAGAEYQKLLEGILDAAPDPISGVLACFEGAAQLLEQTGYADACPIETVALEVASTNETLRLACAGVFTAWLDEATRRLEGAGVPRKRARELASQFVGAIEGAFVLARTLRSPEPLLVAGRATADAIARALADSSRPRSQRRRPEPGKRRLRPK